MMLREYVLERMRSDKATLICGKHKAAKYYGSIAKWVPPGLRQSFLVYGSMPGKRSDKFFEPANYVEGGTDHFHFAAALKACGKHYTPNHVHPRINLIRKLCHSALVQHSREHELMKVIGKADGHSVNMAFKTYALAGPKQDANTAELIYRLVFGEPIPWPSAAEIEARQSETMKAVADVGNLMQTIRDDDAGDFSGDEKGDEQEDEIYKLILKIINGSRSDLPVLGDAPLACGSAAASSCAAAEQQVVPWTAGDDSDDECDEVDETERQGGEKCKHKVVTVTTDKKAGEDHEKVTKGGAVKGEQATTGDLQLTKKQRTDSTGSAAASPSRGIVHGAVPENMQASIDEEMGVAKPHGRPPHFTVEQKTWIVEQIAVFMGETAGKGSAPNNDICRHIVRVGIEQKMIREDTTFEQVRHIGRVWSKKG